MPSKMDKEIIIFVFPPIIFVNIQRTKIRFVKLFGEEERRENVGAAQ